MKVTVSRKSHFNAAHRLYNKNWSDEKNEEVFGKCSNPEYHGHNYEFIVSVKGEIDPQTGFVIDLNTLKGLMKEHVEDKLDHKNLNTQVAEFKEVNPTAENIAVLIFNILRRLIDAKLDLNITLFETPRNFVEVGN